MKLADSKKVSQLNDFYVANDDRVERMTASTI